MPNPPPGTTIPPYTSVGQFSNGDLATIWNALNNIEQAVEQTYFASVTGLLNGATPTDVFTISGSATKKIKIKRYGVVGIKSVNSNIDVISLIRTTLNTGGTSTSPTIVKADSTNATPTAIVKAYTLNPTLGTLNGNIRSSKLFFNTLGNAGSTNLLVEFGTGNNQAPILNGVNDMFCINANGQIITGGNWDIFVEFTEIS